LEGEKNVEEKYIKKKTKRRKEGVGKRAREVGKNEEEKKRKGNGKLEGWGREDGWEGGTIVEKRRRGE